VTEHELLPYASPVAALEVDEISGLFTASDPPFSPAVSMAAAAAAEFRLVRYSPATDVLAVGVSEGVAVWGGGPIFLDLGEESDEMDRRGFHARGGQTTGSAGAPRGLIRSRTNQPAGSQGGPPSRGR
jgi:hypothetical protein